jgi:hypothetical protein
MKEPASEIFRDGMALDETGQQALTEQLHRCLRVPGFDRVKCALVREGTVCDQQVPVGI